MSSSWPSGSSVAASRTRHASDVSGKSVRWWPPRLSWRASAASAITDAAPSTLVVSHSAAWGITVVPLVVWNLTRVAARMSAARRSPAASRNGPAPRCVTD